MFPHAEDLTVGSLGKQIFRFRFPLILTNLLQVLFNMADVAVVGHFAGAAALGSVGSTTILVTLFTCPVLTLMHTRDELMDGADVALASSISASRGLGWSVGPRVIVFLGSCVFRIIWIHTVFAHFHTIPSLYLLYPFFFILTAVFEMLYFVRAYRQQTAQL